MTKEEALLKIKDQLKKLMSFGEEPAKAEEEMKYATMKLKDGSEIAIADGTELGVGVEVMKVDAEGNKTPCDDGEYELEDGRKISCKDSKVESIAEIAVEEAKKEDETPMNPAEMEKKMEEMPKEEEKKMEDGEGEGMKVEDRVAALENQLAQVLEILQGMSKMQEVAMSKIETIASEPAAESIKIGKEPKLKTSTAFSSVKSEIEELKEVRKRFNISSNGGYSFTATKTEK